MVKMKNFIEDNGNISIIDQNGIFTIFEHIEDKSVIPSTAELKYYMSQMNCTMKQVHIRLDNNAVRLKPGEMQIMSGNVTTNTGVTGVGDLLGKMVKSKMTGDAPIKPVYKGTGFVLTEPTYQHLIIEDVAKWEDGMVCDDGMFVCCDDEVKDDVVMRSNLSSAALGGEGLFSLCLRGNGLAVIKSAFPREELYEVILENDTFKIDGNNAICWSNSLQFTVEKSGKSLIGSAASGEGLVNVYRGTGRILMAPLR